MSSPRRRERQFMPREHLRLFREFDMDPKIKSNKKEKLHIIDWLVENFPQAFFKRANQVKPLQIGIFDEIVSFYDRLESPPFSKKLLQEALSYYSSSPAYLSCQILNTARVDLFGNEVGVVNEEQAKYAHQSYQRRYEKKKANDSEEVPQN